MGTVPKKFVEYRDTCNKKAKEKYIGATNRKYDDCSVEFEDGTVKDGVSVNSFNTGSVAYPEADDITEEEHSFLYLYLYRLHYDILELMFDKKIKKSDKERHILHILTDILDYYLKSL